MTLDYRKLRATDIRDNPRVQLLQANEVIWAIEDYAVKTCKNNSTQLDSNLIRERYEGIKKWEIRKNAGEIIVGEADKSGNMTVWSRENYSKQGVPHVEKERLVTWKQKRETKKVIK